MMATDGDMFVLNINQRITELDANVNELRFMLENRQKFPDPEDYPSRDYYAKLLARTAAHRPI